MTSIFYTTIVCELDLDEIELTDTDILPLDDNEFTAVWRELDPFQRFVAQET